jgi:pyruvate formate lyase activating enzyme
MTRLGPDVPLHFTAFHPDDKMLGLPCTPASTLTKARDVAREVGLNFVYTANVHNATGESTYCPGCGDRIIGRDWYDIRNAILMNPNDRLLIVGQIHDKCSTPWTQQQS